MRRNNGAKMISKKHSKGMGVHIQIRKHHKSSCCEWVSAASMIPNRFKAIKREVVCGQSADDNKATLNYLTVNSHLQMCSC